MTERLTTELTAIGADVNEGLGICMNMESLYKKLLEMFVRDTNFALMQAAIEEGDCPKAYEHAHALKGVTANIGFRHLLEPLTRIMQEMKEGHIEQVRDQLLLLVERYNDTCRVIRTNLP